MNLGFEEMNSNELVEVEGGNPVAVYTAIVVGKHVLIPAAKIAVESAIGGFVVKAIGDIVKR